MSRPMSFSDRQIFIQTLAACRNLSVECEKGERDGSLRDRCEELQHAIDKVAGELVGDEAYFHVQDYPQRA